MTQHETAAVGLWATTSDEERFAGPFYDTREEAVDAAIAKGDTHVAEVTEASSPEWAADNAVDWMFAWDGLDEHIRCQDEWGWREDQIIAAPSVEARKELEALLADWFRRHDLVEVAFTAEAHKIEETK